MLGILASKGPISGTGLKTGQTVRVYGTRSDDGSVAAVSITIR